MKVPFFEFRDFPRGIEQEVNQSIQNVVTSHNYVLGSEVKRFEERFASHLGSKYCVGVGNGYDALCLALRLLEISEGDEVLINANSIPVTLMAIHSCGALPVLVPFDENTGQMLVDGLDTFITSKTKAVLPVHLYGESADLDCLASFCERNNLILLEDFAHAHDSKSDKLKVGTYGMVSATSFYPTKTLGAFGDAGAIVTDSEELYLQALQLRNYGKNEKGHYTSIGINSRLDEVQAAVLLVKLNYLEEMKKERLRILYNYVGAGLPLLARNECGCNTPHQVVMKVDNNVEVIELLKQKGIGSAIHYNYNPNDEIYKYCKWGNAEVEMQLKKYSSSIISLPFYLGMTEEEQNLVIDSVLEIID